MINDILQRFIINDAHVRGEYVRLHTSLQQSLAKHDYHPFTQRLLGQALSAVVLMSATIKFDGKITLQIQGNKDAALSLLVAECDSQYHLRSLAIQRHTPTQDSLANLIGGAVISINIHTRKRNRPYQSIVPMQGDTLAACLEHYFSTSEQLPTKIQLFDGEEKTAGLLLQIMPNEQRDADDWQRLGLLADSLTPEEALQLPPQDILYRLFHEQEVELFREQFIRFQCNCSTDKMRQAVQTLSDEEIAELFETQETITLHCDFCCEEYVFSAEDLQSE